MPLFVHISAIDWLEGGWDLPQSIQLAKVLRPLGVDLIDTSSGALLPHVKIPVAPLYQVPFAMAIRREAPILTGALGLITELQQANQLITSGEADLVFLAREFCVNPTGLKKRYKLFLKSLPIPHLMGMPLNVTNRNIVDRRRFIAERSTASYQRLFRCLAVAAQ